MGKTTSDILNEYEEMHHAETIKERDQILTRKENFEREQLAKKLKSIDRLSESISMLASSIAHQYNTKFPHISIYIDKDTSSESLEAIFSKINIRN